MDAGADAGPMDADRLRKLVAEGRARRAAATTSEREPAAQAFVSELGRFAEETPEPMLAARALCLAAEETEDVLGDSDGAVALFRQALARNPSLERAATQAEVLLQRQGHHEQRCSMLLERAERLDAIESSSEAARALAYRQAGAALVDAGADLSRAIDVYERAAELDPEVNTLEALADLYAKREQPGDEEQAADILTSIAEALSGGEAINFAQRALSLMPDHDEAMDLLERLVPQAQHGQVLRRRLEAYVERAGADEDAHPRRVSLARIYGEQGKLKEALACLAPAVEVKDPEAVALRKQLLEEGIGGGARGGGTLVGVPLQEGEDGEPSGLNSASPEAAAAGLGFEAEHTETGTPPPPSPDSGPPPAADTAADTGAEGHGTEDGAATAEEATVAEAVPAEAAPDDAGHDSTEATEVSVQPQQPEPSEPAQDPQPALQLAASEATASTAEPEPPTGLPEAGQASEPTAETKAPSGPPGPRTPSGWPSAAPLAAPAPESVPASAPSWPAPVSEPESPGASAPPAAASSWPAPPISAPPISAPPGAQAGAAPSDKPAPAPSSIHPRGDIASTPPPGNAGGATGGLRLALVAAAVMILAMVVTLLWPGEEQPATTGTQPAEAPAAAGAGKVAKARPRAEMASQETASAPPEATETAPPAAPAAQGPSAGQAPAEPTDSLQRATDDGLRVEITPSRIMIAGAPLDDQKLYAAVSDLQPQFIDCYREARTRYPQLQGRVVLLYLLAQGKPTGARTAAGGTIKDTRLGRCLSTAVDEADMPVPSHHQTRIRLPVEFHANDAP